MAITGAGTSNDHLINGEVVFLLDGEVFDVSQVFVSEGVEPSKSDPEVGSLQQILDLHQ